MKLSPNFNRKLVMLKIADSAFVPNASERLAMEANTLSNMVDSVVAFAIHFQWRCQYFLRL